MERTEFIEKLHSAVDRMISADLPDRISQILNYSWVAGHELFLPNPCLEFGKETVSNCSIGCALVDLYEFVTCAEGDELLVGRSYLEERAWLRYQVELEKWEQCKRENPDDRRVKVAIRAGF